MDVEKLVRLQGSETRAKRTGDRDTESGDGDWQVFLGGFILEKGLGRNAVNLLHRSVLREHRGENVLSRLESSCGVRGARATCRAVGSASVPPIAFTGHSPEHAHIILSLSVHDDSSF